MQKYSELIKYLNEIPETFKKNEVNIDDKVKGFRDISGFSTLRQGKYKQK